MANGFDLRQYKSFEELCYRASLELSPNDLLYIRKFGRSTTLAADVTEDVWETEGTKNILTSPETMTVVSTSANDTALGTGAQAVFLQGVDGDYNILNELVFMNGTGGATTTNQFLAVNRVRVVASGSGKANAGIITCIGDVTSTTQATMPAGDSITQQSHFTIPAGYTAWTVDVVLSVYRSSGSGTKSAEIDQMVYVPDINTQYQTTKYGVSSDGGGPFTATPGLKSQTPGKTTLWFRATAEVNNTVVSSIQSFVLLKGNFNFITEF